MIVKVFTLARVAKLADARDLKSRVPKGTYRFDSGPGHHGLVDVASVNAGSFGLWKNDHCACFVLSGSNSFLNLLCRQPQISAGHDVVTIKNIARFVSADRHRYALRHTAPDHVEIEFWTRVNAAHPSCADLETKWQHDLEFLGMTVDDVLRTDREFVREAWSKISAVADVLDAGYVIVPRMKWIEAAQCFEEAIPA